MKYIVRSTVAVLLLCVAAAIWLAVDMHRFAHRPAGSDKTPVIVSVSPGETFAALTASLAQSVVITDVCRFKWLARIKGDDKRLKAGEFSLTRAMAPVEVLDTLVNGKVYLHRLTIPEGYTIEQIAQELARTGLADPEVFKRMAYDAATVKAFALHGPSLEGYLFPDTYAFPKTITAAAVIETMVAHFKTQFSPLWQERATILGLTPHQVVTLASIIEKETGDPSERPLIASVFHNRLKKGMRLESDPTVIYGIEDFNGNLTRAHLRTATPYNTYVIRGLPPGPIANPGSAALHAALYPTESEYLFFVSRKDGTHQFSHTIEEHIQAVRKFQLRRRSR
ncbi:MAG: endolytic transglycosylase MltG [Desulfatitalea sp.]|nr:endolytic transglycosylase MltG [Desulfatitalea sp.]NNK02105.1 endolytic transglycosylase MltG [Desulfatitalea sp.]